MFLRGRVLMHPFHRQPLLHTLHKCIGWVWLHHLLPIDLGTPVQGNWLLPIGKPQAWDLQERPYPERGRSGAGEEEMGGLCQCFCLVFWSCIFFLFLLHTHTHTHTHTHMYILREWERGGYFCFLLLFRLPMPNDNTERTRENWTFNNTACA